MEDYDVLILGSGAGGYSAAIYASRYNMSAAVIGKEPGGVASEASEVENYPGFKKITGLELMEKFRGHVQSLGSKVFIYSDIVSVKKHGNKFIARLEDGKEFSGKALIVALGSKRRKLEIPGEKEFAGRGVSYCATCDAAFFKDRTVAIIGGNDSAAKAALVLADIAKKVYIIYRKDKIRAEPVLADRIDSKGNIEYVYNAVPLRIQGVKVVKSVVIKQNGKERKIPLDGIFIEIGSTPEDTLTAMLKLEKDVNGYIKVGQDMSTSIPGVFAAGDVTTGSNMFRQLVTAVAEGAIAAESAYRYLSGKTSL
ncbi:MAG: FAD-dependent oxidoreductase [Candidatus Aenigmarchaeota archaeon]|nr:FAD-dependent oxidoreductase [Candidatus Aenigmarchaeota archaeon]